MKSPVPRYSAKLVKLVGTSNAEWVNPHDPDAKVGVAKHGACDMIYKPQHVTDLDSGAIVAATVRLGNEGDTQGLAERVLAVGATLSRPCNDPKQAKVLQSLTADEGYRLPGVSKGHGPEGQETAF